MNADVTEYIQNIDQPWQAEIASAMHRAIHQAVPDVEELLQYKKPHFLKGGKYLAVLGVAKSWVTFTIFNAQELNIPDGMFESDGPPERKTVKVRKDQEVDYNVLGKLVEQAASTL
jgi:hypothetical protein